MISAARSSNIPEPSRLASVRATLWTAARNRCPACQKGALFDGYLALVPACAMCGHPWRATDTGDGPAVFVIFIVGALVGGLALWTEVRFAPPVWLHMLMWLPLTVILSAVLLRFGKALLVGVIYRQTAAHSGPSEP